MNKRLEMFGKSLRAHFIRQNTDFSVKPPHEFAKRFKRKVRRIFRVEIAGITGKQGNNLGLPMNQPNSSYTPMQRFHHEIKNQRLTNAHNNIIEEEDEIKENSLTQKNAKEIRTAALEEDNHSDDDGEGSYRPKYD